MRLQEKLRLSWSLLAHGAPTESLAVFPEIAPYTIPESGILEKTHPDVVCPVERFPVSTVGGISARSATGLADRDLSA